MTTIDIENTHEKLRSILIDNGCEEYGDCIVDDICHLFGYPSTIDIDTEENNDTVKVETVETTTIENNKLIAEFMGGFKEGTEFIYLPSEGRHVKINELLYHSDWNRLMPVVEKIEKTNYGTIEIKSKNLVLISYNGDTIPYFSNSLLINTFEAVVEFIKWYNLNNQKNEK